MLAALGMVAGAFGSHGLRKRPGMTPDTIHAWETASHYAVSVYVVAMTNIQATQPKQAMVPVLLNVH